MIHSTSQLKHVKHWGPRVWSQKIVSQTLKSSYFLSGKAAAETNGNFPWENAGRAKIWKMLKSYGVGNTVWPMGTMREHLAFNTNLNCPLAFLEFQKLLLGLCSLLFIFGFRSTELKKLKVEKTFTGAKKNRDDIVIVLRWSLDVLQINK